MKMNNEEQKHLIEAKHKARKIMLFYIHLVGYAVFIGLMVYNLYIVEGYYKNTIISLNLSIIVAWTVFILVHGLIVFKGQKIFKKSWEDKKIDRFLKEKDNEETTFWE